MSHFGIQQDQWYRTKYKCELVREIGGQMEATIRHLNAKMPDLLPTAMQYCSIKEK
ncbi:hypothetical protein [Nostoc sp. NMS4]|uniref:hypothetical protein n=1 Tax=Nostoc sp. NMS4 TaxID=2815390 RepID=UPI0025F995C3|nr:hypothetical protein [Nostoc sp. NMS4]MBN3922097.1 hypothetical protein [Nostoc sp. NMS4]